MVTRKILKRIHFAGIVWLILSAGCISIVTLRQVGSGWFVSASLSGYSMIMAALFMSWYLFAILRGMVHLPQPEKEHPLTSSQSYLLFYDASPFLGALAGLAGALGGDSSLILMMATGSFVISLLVWVIIDPVAGLVEMFLPESKKYRQKRIMITKVKKQKYELQKNKMLEGLKAEQEAMKIRFNDLLANHAERLSDVMSSDKPDQSEIIDLGVEAWRIGGLGSMRHLHSMAVDRCRQRGVEVSEDKVSVCWEGIGSWYSS